MPESPIIDDGRCDVVDGGAGGVCKDRYLRAAIPIATADAKASAPNTYGRFICNNTRGIVASVLAVLNKTTGVDRCDVIVCCEALGGLLIAKFFDFSDPFGAGRGARAEENAENVLDNSPASFEVPFGRVS